MGENLLEHFKIETSIIWRTDYRRQSPVCKFLWIEQGVFKLASEINNPGLI